MSLIWSAAALVDLSRLHRFLAPKSRRAATNVLRSIRAGTLKLVDYPRLGETIDTMEPREVRRLFVGDYEVRYEVKGEDIHVLRIWHTREAR